MNYALGVFSLLCSILASSKASPGWLKVCGGNSSYFIHAGGCPKGIKIDQPVAVNCVCVTGVWSLSQGECDTRPYLLVGNGHCFALEDALVSDFKFIGRPSVPFAPAILVGSSLFNAFWSLPLKETEKANGTMVILSINEDKVVSAKGIACCARDPLHADKPVHICFGAPRGDYMLRSQCFYSAVPVPELYRLALGFGDGIRLGSSSGEQQLLFSTPACSRCGSKEKFQFETDCCAALPYEHESNFIAVDVKRYDKQTNRLIGEHLDFTLKNKKPHELKTFEYEQLRTGATLLAKVCTPNTVPKDLLKIVLRFFKQVVNESVEEFVMERTIDHIHHGRIMSILMTCSSSASQWKIRRNPGACNDPVVEISDGQTVLAVMPEPEQHNPQKLDFVMESVWKIILFTYYYCSKFFAEAPSDAAFLLKGLERFFSADLIRRWTHPGNSFNAFKFIMPNYNLVEFIWALDACVAAAKLTSDIKLWLPRPYLRYQAIYSENSCSIWGGKGSCLNTYWYPKSQYEDTCVESPGLSQN